MLKEIIRNLKSKAVIVVVIMFFLIIVSSCSDQTKVENDVFTTKINVVNEILPFYGHWKITEYLGRGVDSHISEVITEGQKNAIERAIEESKVKYLNKELYIGSNSIMDYSPPSELGYSVLTWQDLFVIYRQPPDIWDGISPPFVCISISLKDYDDTIDLIADSNGNVTLVVEGKFFRLENVEK